VVARQVGVTKVNGAVLQLASPGVATVGAESSRRPCPCARARHPRRGCKADAPARRAVLAALARDPAVRHSAKHPRRSHTVAAFFFRRSYPELFAVRLFHRAARRGGRFHLRVVRDTNGHAAHGPRRGRPGSRASACRMQKLPPLAL
jgi:hypothetical protein